MEQATGSPAAKLVLVKLADNANETGYCWPTVALIVRHTELSERAVRNILHRLEKLGLITCAARRHNGRGAANEYQLNLGDAPVKGAVAAPLSPVKGASGAPLPVDDTVDNPVYENVDENGKGASGAKKGAFDCTSPTPPYIDKPSSKPLRARARASSPDGLAHSAMEGLTGLGRWSGPLIRELGREKAQTWLDGCRIDETIAAPALALVCPTKLQRDYLSDRAVFAVERALGGQHVEFVLEEFEAADCAGNGG